MSRMTTLEASQQPAWAVVSPGDAVLDEPKGLLKKKCSGMRVIFLLVQPDWDVLPAPFEILDMGMLRRTAKLVNVTKEVRAFFTERHFSIDEEQQIIVCTPPLSLEATRHLIAAVNAEVHADRVAVDELQRLDRLLAYTPDRAEIALKWWLHKLQRERREWVKKSSEIKRRQQLQAHAMQLVLNFTDTYRPEPATTGKATTAIVCDSKQQQEQHEQQEQQEQKTTLDTQNESAPELTALTVARPVLATLQIPHPIWPLTSTIGLDHGADDRRQMANQVVLHEDAASAVVSAAAAAVLLEARRADADAGGVDDEDAADRVPPVAAAAAGVANATGLDGLSEQAWHARLANSIRLYARHAACLPVDPLPKKTDGMAYFTVIQAVVIMLRHSDGAHAEQLLGEALQHPTMAAFLSLRFAMASQVPFWQDILRAGGVAAGVPLHNRGALAMQQTQQALRVLVTEEMATVNMCAPTSQRVPSVAKYMLSLEDMLAMAPPYSLGLTVAKVRQRQNTFAGFPLEELDLADSLVTGSIHAACNYRMESDDWSSFGAYLTSAYPVIHTDVCKHSSNFASVNSQVMAIDYRSACLQNNAAVSVTLVCEQQPSSNVVWNGALPALCGETIGQAAASDQSMAATAAAASAAEAKRLMELSDMHVRVTVQYIQGESRECRMFNMAIEPGSDLDIAVDVDDDAMFDVIAHKHFAVVQRHHSHAKLVRSVTTTTTTSGGQSTGRTEHSLSSLPTKITGGAATPTVTPIHNEEEGQQQQRQSVTYTIVAGEPRHVPTFRRVQMYRATMSTVCSHHVAMTRSALTSKFSKEPTVWLTASHALTAFTGSTPNYHYFASKKVLPQDVLLRYRTRGFHTRTLPVAIHRALSRYETRHWSTPYCWSLDTGQPSNGPWPAIRGLPWGNVFAYGAERTALANHFRARPMPASPPAAGSGARSRRRVCRHTADEHAGPPHAVQLCFKGYHVGRYVYHHDRWTEEEMSSSSSSSNSDSNSNGSNESGSASSTSSDVIIRDSYS